MRFSIGFYVAFLAPKALVAVAATAKTAAPGMCIICMFLLQNVGVIGCFQMTMHEGYWLSLFTITV